MSEVLKYLDLDYPRIEGDPFRLARETCEHAVRVARDVAIDESRLQHFAEGLDATAVRKVTLGPMGENCDVGAGDFSEAREAANFAVVFALLQFGHGFRYELHDLCGRGASKTITLGVSNLRQGGFSASRLSRVDAEEVRAAFQLPENPLIDEFALQIRGVLRQAGQSLERAEARDFDTFCRRILETEAAAAAPAATLVRELANAFPAFNDQGEASDGSTVVFLKKATLAIGELIRVTAPHDPFYGQFHDQDRAVATVDNVLPAVLVYHRVLRLSDRLHRTIHVERQPLPRGPAEAELRAAALVVCDRLVEMAGRRFSALDLGYYLWLAGKIPEIRRFARHHTKDTVYY